MAPIRRAYFFTGQRGSTATQESKEAALIDPVLETMDRDLKIATGRFFTRGKTAMLPLFEAWENHGSEMTFQPTRGRFQLTNMGFQPSKMRCCHLRR